MSSKLARQSLYGFPCRGKSGLHRAGCRLTTGRREARNRATETSVLSYGETRQPPSGARPNREAMVWLAPLPGRLLEPWGNPRPRGMTVHDRTRLIGQLLFSPIFPFKTGVKLPPFTVNFVLRTGKNHSPQRRRGAEEKQWVVELNGFTLFIDFSASRRLCGE
jgi:hypothetical protein